MIENKARPAPVDELMTRAQIACMAAEVTQAGDEASVWLAAPASAGQAHQLEAELRRIDRR